MIRSGKMETGGKSCAVGVSAGNEDAENNKNNDGEGDGAQEIKRRSLRRKRREHANQG